MSSAHQALDRIRPAAAHSGAALVGFSGGKDALVTLDLCRQVFDRVECYFMELVPGLSFIEELLDSGLRQCGSPVLHRVPHWSLQRMFQAGYYSPRIRGLETRTIREADILSYLRKQTGIEWIADGERMDDSIRRRWVLRKRGAVDWRFLRLHPIYDWHTRDVLEYLRIRRIHRKDTTFGHAARMTGMAMLRREQLEWVRTHHPADYRRICEFFPSMEAVHVRNRIIDATEGGGGSEAGPVQSEVHHEGSAQEVGAEPK